MLRGHTGLRRARASMTSRKDASLGKHQAKHSNTLVGRKEFVMLRVLTKLAALR